MNYSAWLRTDEAARRYDAGEDTSEMAYRTTILAAAKLRGSATYPATIRRTRTDSLMLCQTALDTGSVVTTLSVMGMTIVKGR